MCISSCICLPCHCPCNSRPLAGLWACVGRSHPSLLGTGFPRLSLEVAVFRKYSHRIGATGRARIERAWRAGCWAGCVLAFGGPSSLCRDLAALRVRASHGRRRLFGGLCRRNQEKSWFSAVGVLVLEEELASARQPSPCALFRLSKNAGRLLQQRTLLGLKARQRQAS